MCNGERMYFMDMLLSLLEVRCLLRMASQPVTPHNDRLLVPGAGDDECLDLL